MLLFPLGVMVMNIVDYATLYRQVENRQMSTSQVFEATLMKWVLSFILFWSVYTWNNSNLLKTVGYDPSGHYMCCMVAVFNWVNLVNVSRKTSQDALKSSSQRKVGERQ